MARMTPEQRRMWQDIVHSIRAIDGVSAVMQQQILAVIRAFPAFTFTPDHQRSLMRQIDTIINDTFGLSRDAAPRSVMFLTMRRELEQAALNVYADAYNDMRQKVIRSKGLRAWERIEANMRFLPLGSTNDVTTVARMMHGDPVARTRLLRSQSLDVQRRWVPRDRWNTKDGYRLSDRLWQHGRMTRDQIDAQIRQMIKDGTDPIRMAKELEQHLTEYGRSKTIYNADGRIIQRKGMTKAPRGGWGNTAARRLVRTELVRVNGAATIESGKAIPGVRGIQWLLSNRHEDSDECDDKASRDSFDLGRGVYPFDQVPQFPSHPNDICCLSHAHLSREATVDLIVSKYLREF